MTPEALLIEDLILAAGRYTGKNISISLGVSDAYYHVIVEHPGSKTRCAVFDPFYEPPYAIDTVSVEIGRVEIRVQCHRRPASSDEMESLSSDKAFGYYQEYRAVRTIK